MVTEQGICPYCHKPIDDHIWLMNSKVYVYYCLGGAPLPPPIGPASKGTKT